MYALAVIQANKMLGNINLIMAKAEVFAAQKKIDPNVFVMDRLAADQFPFVKQIQIATDTAKGMAARLAGKEPPKYEDNEKTWNEIKARVQKTQEYLATFKSDDFIGYEDRVVPISFMPGKCLNAVEYLHEMAMPNIYFHITTAYSILRFRGVDLGKAEFLGHLEFKNL